eukprot:Pompholyxophrys_sp_v1_NODE_72_length_2434_cov_5.681379.p2 type:complete len:110 gc:universal NODE_72_length_2434_cov_5.681379:1383-1712(+)
MTDDAWPNWIKHFIDCLPPKEERKNIFLILDGYGSHEASVQLEKENIYLFALPSHLLLSSTTRRWNFCSIENVNSRCFQVMARKESWCFIQAPKLSCTCSWTLGRCTKH